MRRGALVCLLLGGVALSACGSSAAPESAPRVETVIDPMLQQMERAKQQGAEMEKRKDRLDIQL
ncbi:MAG: hypothetical protein ABIT36_02800 [Steroidobacteraceae bacterium]